MCRRCHAEDVRTDQRGLCKACRHTDALPGLPVERAALVLENEPVSTPSRRLPEAVQESLFN